MHRMHATTHTHTYTHTHCKQSKRPVSSPRRPHSAPPSAPSRGSSPEQRGSTERQLHRLRTHGLHPVSQDALSRRYTPVERRAHQHMAEQTSARCTRCTPAPSTPPPAQQTPSYPSALITRYRHAINKVNLTTTLTLTGTPLGSLPTRSPTSLTT